MERDEIAFDDHVLPSGGKHSHTHRSSFILFPSPFSATVSVCARLMLQRDDMRNYSHSPPYFASFFLPPLFQSGHLAEWAPHDLRELRPIPSSTPSPFFIFFPFADCHSMPHTRACGQHEATRTRQQRNSGTRQSQQIPYALSVRICVTCTLLLRDCERAVSKWMTECQES
jgi:hypothetical protein